MLTRYEEKLESQRKLNEIMKKIQNQDFDTDDNLTFRSCIKMSEKQNKKIKIADDRKNLIMYIIKVKVLQF